MFILEIGGNPNLVDETKFKIKNYIKHKYQYASAILTPSPAYITCHNFFYFLFVKQYVFATYINLLLDLVDYEGQLV